ncbi:MAG: DUF5666 domain-containing protein [Acidobacteriaceae bacterium]|nr:DUF5666 domain-containing protein [Acidobacteriaceae bacterium]
MQINATPSIRGGSIALVAALLTSLLTVAGCSSAGTTAASLSTNSTTTNITSAKTSVPVSITDAPGSQIVATSLTLNSIVLTDSNGLTASILSAPIPFEATHLDAVQEPLFTPAVPEDTYTSVALTYSNAEVTYIDPSTKKLVQTSGTLANTSQTITFSSPITINNTTTSLLIDYLVANSVSISGSTVTVTPTFNVAAVAIPAQPTNGTNGLQCGIVGEVTALGTNSFTLTNASGTALVIDVNASTVYQGLSGFSALALDEMVEVDTVTQSSGILLAARVATQAKPSGAPTPAEMLVGPVTATTGSPVTSFTQVVRQNVGGASSSATTTNTITIDSSTTFLLPPRFGNVTGGAQPLTSTFSASTLFAGQVVSVATSGVTNNAATALSVALSPQTVDGTIASVVVAANANAYTAYTLTLVSGSWLATLTGQTTVTVYTNGNVQSINGSAFAVGSTARFNGFLFNNNGALVLLADVQAGPPGTPIVGHP